jgi:D-alanine-D-alanine ligase-like ATP-grasp enzyme
MRSLQEFRAGKPGFYPDQAVYAAYSSAEFGLAFEDLDRGTGLIFRVSSTKRSMHFGAGRCSYYPQNNATSATLASDKYFANRILDEAGVPTLGGKYFFLHARHRAQRPNGHEREDAFEYLRELNSTAFVKPLTGSRGDFAQVVHSKDALDRYLLNVAEHYDAVLMQPVVSGPEYRIFLLDGDIVYSARKFPPRLAGDGRRSLRDLFDAHNDLLKTKGLSPIDPEAIPQSAIERVLPPGEVFEIAGRMNLSTGGRMAFETPRSSAALTMAQRAAQALELRVAAVDLFVGINDDPDAIRIIEVNSNPSIRLLEELDRGDLILRIWHHAFSAGRLFDV